MSIQVFNKNAMWLRHNRHGCDLCLDLERHCSSWGRMYVDFYEVKTTLFAKGVDSDLERSICVCLKSLPGGRRAAPARPFCEEKVVREQVG